VHRLDFAGQLSRLLDELDTWQGELRCDVTRAELRGLHLLACDLRKLNRRVDRVLEIAHPLRGPA
jgi:hypothetical protein